MPQADGRPGWMVSADETILKDFHQRRLDYPPLVASRCGLHVTFVERRCRELADRGFLELVTSEVTYRITSRGRRYLDDQEGSDKLDIEPDAPPGT